MGDKGCEDASNARNCLVHVAIVYQVSAELHLEGEPQRCRLQPANELDVMVAKLIVGKLIIIIQLVVDFIDGISDFDRTQAAMDWTG